MPEVKFDGAKRDAEIQGQQYKIGGTDYRRRKVNNAVQAQAEEISIEINRNRLELVAAGKALDVAFLSDDEDSEALGEAIATATARQKELRAEQRDLIYQQAACFLEDEAGTPIPVEVLREHMDRDDVVALLGAMAGDDGESDPTPPAE